MISHYCFFNSGLEFQDSVCNGCHDLTLWYLKISVISIITIKSVDYRWIIHDISKSEAINLLKNSVFEDRGCIYKKYCFKFQLLQDSFIYSFV